MPAVISLLEQAAPPRAPTRTARAESPVKQATVGSAFSGLADSINGIEDEFTRDIIKGLIEQRLGVKLKTPQEQEYERNAIEIQLREQKRKLASLRVSEAYATLLNNPEAFGKVSADILSNPDQFIGLTQVAKQYGLLDFTLAPGDLELGGLASVRETTAEKVGKQSSAINATENVAKAVQAGAEGKGVIGATLEATKQSAGQRFDVNLGTGMLSDIDEGEGSAGLLSAYTSAQNQIGGAVGKEAVAQAFLKQNGSNLKDQLEGLGRTEDGKLIVGKGDLGVSDRATFNLSQLVRQMAYDLGVSDTEIMSQLGLDYSGIDEFSTLVSSVKYAPTPEAKQRVVEGLAQRYGPEVAQAIASQAGG